MLKKKFAPAIAGLKKSLSHKAVMIQFILAFFALTACFIIRVDYYELLVVMLCIGLVIAAEMFNTCIELLCDLYSEEINERIRIIKDIAAGTVLIASVIALACALIILMKHI